MRCCNCASNDVDVAVEEAHRVLDIARVVLGAHQADARARAATDLVQQARPRAVGEHGVFAGAQLEHLLDQPDRLFHRPGAGVRPEVAVLAIDAAAVVGDARHLVRHELEVRIALVVAEQDVEARREGLDQVVLEQQRLGLAAHHGRFEPRDAPDHVADARIAVRLVEVARDALLQVARLADVEHAVGMRRSSGTRPAGSAARPLRRAGALWRLLPHPRLRGELSIGTSLIDLDFAASIIEPCAGICSAVSSTTGAMPASAGGLRPTWQTAASTCGSGSTMRRRCRGWRRRATRGSRSCRGLPMQPDLEPLDVVIEAFGCNPPARFVERLAAMPQPSTWINLEYLSAEPYVEASHGLPSPQLAGPGRGLMKWFFFPGFGDSNRRPDPRAGPARGARGVRSRCLAGRIGMAATSRRARGDPVLL